MQIIRFIVSHWPEVIQNTGIIGGFLFTGYAQFKDTRVRKAETTLKITEQHRQLWLELMHRKELETLRNPSRSLTQEPLTSAEIRYVGLLVQHLRATFHAHAAGIYTQPKGLGADVKSFFAAPALRAAWNELRTSHDEHFVLFVEKLIG